MGVWGPRCMLAIVPGAAWCLKIWKSPLPRPTVSVMSIAKEKKKVITSPTSSHRHPTLRIVDQNIDSWSTMPEEGRRCEYAGGMMTFFFGDRPRCATLQEPLTGEVMIVSRTALKGSKNREFDSPVLKACFVKTKSHLKFQRQLKQKLHYYRVKFN